MSARTLRFALIALALGCAAKGTPFVDYDEISAGNGRLYVYRSTDRAHWLADAEFTVDGKPLADLGAGGYATVLLAPGSHVVSARFDPLGPDTEPAVSDRARIAAGAATFCRFSSGTDVITEHWQIECSDDAEAHAEIRQCVRQPLVEGSPFQR